MGDVWIRFSGGIRHIYLLVVNELLADFAGVKSIKAAAAFS